ncbi:MAG: HD domain-containing phosphohydrolase [Desulfatitalea sp.]
MVLKHPHTLLLVDDEASILKSLTRLFRKENFTILTAGGGAEALEKLGPVAESVSLIVSDQRMPGMTGSEFLEQAVGLAPHAIRFILTGFADMDAVIAAVNKGKIHRYISKPWNDEELLQQVRAALSQVELRLENQRLSALTERQNAELAELNKSLEKTVGQRTWALQYQNKQLQAANTGLEKSLMETIRLLTALVESSNPRLGTYMKAAARLSRELAADAGMDEKAQNQLEMAGLVHDIGLLGMPDTLLEKDLKSMTPEEMAAYRQHPTVACLSLSSVERLRDIGELVLAHHENYDGTGFPNRLQEEQIPLGARILALAADFHTIVHLWPANAQRMLANARRYLDADTFKSLDLGDEGLRQFVAEQIIAQGAGKRYDPSTVMLFLKHSASQRPYQDILSLPVQALTEGLILMQDLRLKDGRLLITRGTVLNTPAVQSIRNFNERGLLEGTIEVGEPRPEAESQEETP